MEPVTYTLPFAAASTRGQIGLGGLAPIRLLVGSKWASTAPIVHVEVSEDGVTYWPLWADGTAYTVPAVAGRASVVDPTKFYAVKYIRLVGTRARGTAEAQSAATTIGIVAKVM